MSKLPLATVFTELMLPTYGDMYYRRVAGPFAALLDSVRVLGGMPVLELHELMPATKDAYDKVVLTNDTDSVVVRHELAWFLEQVAAHIEEESFSVRTPSDGRLLVWSSRDEEGIEDEQVEDRPLFTYGLVGFLNDGEPEAGTESMVLAIGYDSTQEPILVVRIRPGDTRVLHTIDALATRIRDAFVHRDSAAPAEVAQVEASTPTGADGS